MALTDDSHEHIDPHAHIECRHFRSGDSIRAVVFLFHGRGGNVQSIQSQLGQHILCDDVLQVIPEAFSNTWYPQKFNVPEQHNQPWLDSAIGRIHREVRQLLDAGLPACKIIFGGFSQGACMALEYPMRYPQRYGAVFCLSGGVIGPENSRQCLVGNGLDGTPVFLGCADEDAWVPRPKFDESVKLLSDSGASVQSAVYPGLGHNICKDELDRVKQMVTQVVNA